jgi:hypothetical protein
MCRWSLLPIQTIDRCRRPTENLLLRLRSEPLDEPQRSAHDAGIVGDSRAPACANISLHSRLRPDRRWASANDRPRGKPAGCKPGVDIAFSARPSRSLATVNGRSIECQLKVKFGGADLAPSPQRAAHHASIVVVRAAIFTVRTEGPGSLSTMAKPRGGAWLADEMSALRDAGTNARRGGRHGPRFAK